jgi:hypothetical protein
MQYQPEQIPVSPAPQPSVPQQPVVPSPVPPEPPREIPWKIIAFVGGGVVVAAIAVLGVVLVMRSRAPSAGAPQPSGGAVPRETRVAAEAAARRAFEEAKAACANAEDYDACVSGAAVQEATRGEAVELCDEIKDAAARDRCVFEVARRREDEGLCARASATVALYCQSVFQSERARENDDIELCLQVADPVQKESCFTTIVASKDRAFCETLPDAPRERCLSIIFFHDVAQNPELCNELSDPVARESCKREFAAAPPLDSDADGLSDSDEATRGTNPGNPDTDGDGLSDGEEVTRWGTDPLNSDTDEDGFGDGTEVRAGYNPNGAGRLQ